MVFSNRIPLVFFFHSFLFLRINWVWELIIVKYFFYCYTRIFIKDKNITFFPGSILMLKMFFCLVWVTGKQPPLMCYNEFITSWLSILNKVAFGEMHLPSSVNVNDYATHIYSKYADLDKSNRTWVVENGPTWPTQ